MSEKQLKRIKSELGNLSCDELIQLSHEATRRAGQTPNDREAALLERIAELQRIEVKVEPTIAPAGNARQIAQIRKLENEASDLKAQLAGAITKEQFEGHMKGLEKITKSSMEAYKWVQRAYGLVAGNSGVEIVVEGLIGYLPTVKAYRDRAWAVLDSVSSDFRRNPTQVLFATGTDRPEWLEKHQWQKLIERYVTLQDAQDSKDDPDVYEWLKNASKSSLSELMQDT